MTTLTASDLTDNSSAADYETVLANTDEVKELLSNNKFGNFMKDYVNVRMAEQTDLQNQAKEQAQIALAEYLTENGQDPKRINLSPDDERKPLAYQKRHLYNSEAMGAGLDEEFTSTADYLQTIWHRADKEEPKTRERLDKLRNAFGSDVPSEGGFLVPERLRAELLRVSLETSIVRPRARTIPMETLRVPFPAIDSTSNVNNVYGGVTAFWTEEKASLQESQAAFSRIMLDAKKLTAYTEAPSELISDSAISFEALINDIFPEAIGFFEDIAFLTGSGVGEPLGVLNGNAAVSVTRDTNAEINWIDVINMYQRMLPGSLNRGVWVASIDTFAQLAQMEISTGSPAVWINPALSEGPPMSLLGRPILFSEKVPQLNSTGDLSFIDFGFYLLGDRQAMSARSSEEFRFRSDQTAYRFIERVDGRPWLQSAITPHNGGSALSPIVKLGQSA